MFKPNKPSNVDKLWFVTRHLNYRFDIVKTIVDESHQYIYKGSISLKKQALNQKMYRYINNEFLFSQTFSIISVHKVENQIKQKM